MARVSKETTEKRLKWYDHVKCSEEGHVLRRMVDVPVPGKRRRGRRETRYKDSCQRDVESVGLKVENLLGRTNRKREIQMHPGDPR